MIEARVDLADPDQALADLRNRAADGLARMTVYFHTRVLFALNVPNSGVRAGGRTVYPDPSRPGEPPRKRTGWLQRNVLYEVDRVNLTARVGVTDNARYGLFLEVGTVRMEPRPWLAATLRAHSAYMQALFEAAMKG